MKLCINKSLKTAIIIFCSISAVVITAFLIIYCNTPRFAEEKYITYSYSSMGEVSYKVFLIPNILYKDEMIEENNVYITKFVDYINVYFNSSFVGDVPADITGNYEISIIIEGYTSNNNEYTRIWTKGFIIVPMTVIEAGEKSAEISDSFSLYLKDYILFAQKVLEFSDIDTRVKLIARMDANIIADINGSIVEKVISPAIEIPLNESYFKIKKYNTENIPENLEETKRVKLPNDYFIITACSAIIVFMVIFILYLLVFGSEPTKKDRYKKILKKIFKLHGSRLVALDNEIIDTIQNYCKVKTIEDLVRISDELEKPILYEYNADITQIGQFYVFDHTRVYVFDLSNSAAKGKAETIPDSLADAG